MGGVPHGRSTAGSFSEAIDINVLVICAMMANRTMAVVAGAAAGLFLSGFALAQTSGGVYDLSWRTLSGGGKSSGGSYAEQGAIGQALTKSSSRRELFDKQRVLRRRTGQVQALPAAHRQGLSARCTAVGERRGRPSEKKDGLFVCCGLGRTAGFEPAIFWATTRRVNHYATPATRLLILPEANERARGRRFDGRGVRTRH